MKYLIVDGYLNGTGVRDKYEGGYISHEDLRISSKLSHKINCWLDRYWKEFYIQYSNSDIIRKLDAEGLNIAIELQAELTNANIEYFSDAEMSFIKI